jgi:hypothetical protein
MENPPFVDEVLIEMEVSINGGTPKRMVHKDNPIKIYDLGVPPFQEMLRSILANRVNGWE